VKRKRQSDGPFVIMPLKILDSPAWRVMDPVAWALWIALRRKLRSRDFSNNGKIYLACRPAAEMLGVDKGTIARRYAELEHYGFLRKTSEAHLGVYGNGVAPHYRFTDLPHGTHPATRDYERWDGEVFKQPPKESGWKKQNPVRRGRTPRTSRTYIEEPPEDRSLCTAAAYIDEASRCTPATYISRIAICHGSDEDRIQGSLRRAPGKPGGAGSTPAPVANGRYLEAKPTPAYTGL